MTSSCRMSHANNVIWSELSSAMVSAVSSPLTVSLIASTKTDTKESIPLDAAMRSVESFICTSFIDIVYIILVCRREMVCSSGYRSADVNVRSRRTESGCAAE